MNSHHERVEFDFSFGMFAPLFQGKLSLSFIKLQVLALTPTINALISLDRKNSPLIYFAFFVASEYLRNQEHVLSSRSVAFIRLSSTLATMCQIV